MIDAAVVISGADSGARGWEATALVACDAVLVAISADIMNVALRTTGVGDASQGI